MEDCAVLKETLEIAKKSLAILEKQAAGYTALQIPDRLRSDLEERRQEVAELEARFKEKYNEAIAEERESDFLTSEELEEELKWDTKFSNSQDLLASLAAEAMAEYRAGHTQALNPETL